MTGLAVAVVAGGPSAEAEVSRTSARGVAQALATSGHRVDILELDGSLAARLSSGGYDVVFPAVHGPLGEDGCLQGFLEVLGLPYVGSGVAASALGMDKVLAKVIFRSAGLPLAEERVVKRDARGAAAEVVRELRAAVGPAMVLKPTSGGSAIGVTRVAASESDEAVRAALERAFSVSDVVLVERFRAGKEVTCAVLEDDGGVARALSPTLITPKLADWYDFKSRYAAGGSVHQCPAPLAPALLDRIREVARAAHEAIGARDLSRVDFVVDDVASEVTLLEVNTLPGMTPTSLFPEAAAEAGIPFAELCDRLVRRAHRRPRRRVLDGVAMP